MTDLADIPSNRFPRHIAIIMDGNGRCRLFRVQQMVFVRIYQGLP